MTGPPCRPVAWGCKIEIGDKGMGAASDEDRGRALKCPNTGCDLQVYNPAFAYEEALVSSAKGLVRIPDAVRRNFWATCPDHGKVLCADSSGHHITRPGDRITPSETVGIIADEEWQKIAFAVMALHGSRS